MKHWLLKVPSTDDLLSILVAWRIWVVGTVLGMALSAAVYSIAPPPYRAQATVIVDHNVEMVLGEERSDRDLNYYLQRETDKLVLLAFADETLESVSELSGIPLSQLREQMLHLSQPGDGGWHFYADADDPFLAQTLASGWAEAFFVRAQVESQHANLPDADNPSVISPYLTLKQAQTDALPVERSLPLGIYLFAGSLMGAGLLVAFVLFVDRKGS